MLPLLFLWRSLGSIAPENIILHKKGKRYKKIFVLYLRALGVSNSSSLSELVQMSSELSILAILDLMDGLAAKSVLVAWGKEIMFKLILSRVWVYTCYGNRGARTGNAYDEQCRIIFLSLIF